MGLGIWFRVHRLRWRLLLASASGHHHGKPVLVGSLLRLRKLRLLLSLRALPRQQSPRPLDGGFVCRRPLALAYVYARETAKNLPL